MIMVCLIYTPSALRCIIYQANYSYSCPCYNYYIHVHINTVCNYKYKISYVYTYVLDSSYPQSIETHVATFFLALNRPVISKLLMHSCGTTHTVSMHICIHTQISYYVFIKLMHKIT